MEECGEEAEEDEEREGGEGECEEACGEDGLCAPSQYEDEDAALITLSKGGGGEDLQRGKRENNWNGDGAALITLSAQ